MILQGFTMRNAGGMAQLRDPARHRWRSGALPVRSGRGGECAQAPTWPARAKGRQPAPGAARLPLMASQLFGGCCAAFQSVIASRGAIPVRWPALARRAPRALEDVERIVTSRCSVIFSDHVR